MNLKTRYCSSLRFVLNISFYIVILSILSLAIVSCNRVDETNLENVVKYYYQPGSKRAWEGKGKWEFISKASYNEISPEQFERKVDKDCIINSASVLGQEQVGDNVYARVAIIKQCKSNKTNCSLVATLGTLSLTNTWILEDGKWRIISTDKSSEKIKDLFKSGDYAASVKEAEQILFIDPFSIHTYKYIAFGLNRSGLMQSPTKRSIEDVVRSVLSINPKDDEALFIAVTYSQDPQVAKTFLRKMPKDSCARIYTLFNLCTELTDKNEVLELIKDDENNPEILLLKIQALGQLGKYKEAVEVIKNKGKEIQDELTSNDAAYGAGWAAIIAGVCLSSGDKAMAQGWLDYGITRDPNNEKIRTFMHQLK